eukprot:ANDGO_02833.mRNA.1 hypothetical protein
MSGFESIHFWPRIEVFTSGIILSTQSSHFDIPALLRFLHDAPLHIAYDQWLHFGTDFFRLSPHAAEALWNTFHSFVDVRSAVAVTRQFVLFLFLQLYGSSVVVKPQQRNLESWPLEAAAHGPEKPSSTLFSPPQNSSLGVNGQGSSTGHGNNGSVNHSGFPLSPSRSVALQAKAGVDSTALVFVQRHLRDFLVLLSVSDGLVRLSDLDLLHLIIKGGKDLKHPARSLSELCMGLIRARGSVSAASTVQISDLFTFMSKRLLQNEFEYPPLFEALSSSSRVFVVDGAHTTNSDALNRSPSQSPSTATLLNASVLALDESHRKQFADSRVLCIYGEYKKCIMRRGGANSIQKPVWIVCNTQSEVYVPDCVQHVLVFGCTDCTVVIGAAKLVHLEHCERVTIAAASRHGLLAQHCVDCKFFVLSPSPVVCMAFNSQCYSAPLLSFYDALEEDLAEAEISTAINAWDRVLALVAHDVGIVPAVSPSSLFGASNVLLVPTVPFDVKVRRSSSPSTTGYVGSIPREWEQDIEARTDRVRKLHKLVFEACEQTPAPHVARQEMQTVMSQAFREWLHLSGNARHIHDLLHADVAML